MRSRPDTGMREFIGLIAGIMALNALGIDIMLPALPAIGESLNVTGANRTQWIISAYMLGFGITQMIYGPLADRYGRKPVLLASVILFAMMSLLASFAASFALLIGARVLQGMAGAGGRVLSTSIVRDRYSGQAMARVMSLSFMVFLAVPILAPAVGQLTVLFAPWRVIFVLLALLGAALALWIFFRLPETLDPANRREIHPSAIFSAVWETLRSRQAMGYTLASTMLFGSLMGYINSCQQIFAQTFGKPHLLAPMFALIAGSLAIAAFSNSRLVGRFGAARLAFGALCLMIVVSGVHLAWASSGRETLASFVALQFLTMFCIGFTGPNFGALAMEPVGHIAGTASSVQGTISTVGAALVGLTIGQQFDGTSVPVAAGTLACSTITLFLILAGLRDGLSRPISSPSIS